MIKVLNISNHKLSNSQIEMIKEKFNLNDVEIVELPNELKSEFSNLPDSIEGRNHLILKLLELIEKENYNYVHLDGEAHFVSSFIMLFNLSFMSNEKKVFKFYSVRNVIEETDESGKITIKRSVFVPKSILPYLMINLKAIAMNIKEAN